MFCTYHMSGSCTCVTTVRQAQTDVAELRQRLPENELLALMRECSGHWWPIVKELLGRDPVGWQVCEIILKDPFMFDSPCEGRVWRRGALVWAREAKYLFPERNADWQQGDPAEGIPLKVLRKVAYGQVCSYPSDYYMVSDHMLAMVRAIHDGSQWRLEGDEAMSLINTLHLAGPWVHKDGMWTFNADPDVVTVEPGPIVKIKVPGYKGHDGRRRKFIGPEGKNVKFLETLLRQVDLRTQVRVSS